MRRLATTMLVTAFLAAAPARAEVTFKHISAEEAARAVAGPTMPGNIADGPQFSMSLHKRTGPSHVEKHMGWDEELVIQQGTVLLNYGDTASKPRENSPGEFNGEAIIGGKSRMLHAGDIVILPAGLWHEQVPKTPLMRYILFKTRKPAG
jgi:mannose-6-phosphate isomerase-like protein (cupin superfamily)